MAAFRYTVVIIILLAAPSLQGARAQKFLADDPVEVMPPPLPVRDPVDRDLNALYDFFANSLRPGQRLPCRAGDINTLGEVPDSAWFTNRHAKRRMTHAELQKGPETNKDPRAPYTIVGGKTEGISPGFRMKDADGRLYFVKADPLQNPELATGAEVVASKFFYAIGYNVPENYIIFPRLSDFTIAPDAEIRNSAFGPDKRMTWGDFLAITNRMPRSRSGSFRFVASLALEGKPIGSFRFEGTRRDDPNDIVPHEERRDLRGLHVFAAWLNHTDAKALNTLDTVVEKNGVPYVKHHLIDFGASLGSDGDRPKDPRFGHTFILPAPRDAVRISTLGLLVDPWERLDYPDLKAAGNLEAAGFEPEKWKTNYPNPAFLSRQPADEFWAAKIVTAFSDDDIRAIVETGKYTDPAVIDYLTSALIQRRDTIGRTYFSKVLALDRFQIRDGKLVFEDLGDPYGIRRDMEYLVRWFQFDNVRQQQTPLPATIGGRLPSEAAGLPAGAYVSAVIEAREPERRNVTVTFRKSKDGYDLIGVDRSDAP